MNAILTKHGRLRLNERTTLTEQAFTTILDTYRTSSAGYEPKTFRWHRLFYSRPDDKHFVAIQDISNGEVITILPLDYHENLAWKISKKKLRQAIFRVDPHRHAELYMPQPSPSLTKFTITGVFWNECIQSVKKNLGSYRFSSFPTSSEEAAADDALIASILSRLQSKSLKTLTLDEVLLYEEHTGTLYKLPWERITEFSLASDDTISNVAEPCDAANARLRIPTAERSTHMVPLLSGDCEGSDRIRRNNSVKYYREIPSISR